MIKNVIFDYGNVLVDWNPAYLFLPVFNGDEEKCRFFTDNICNREWFTRMDRGEDMDVCVAQLQAQHPDYADAIALFRDRWFDMCHGDIPGMLEIIRENGGIDYIIQRMTAHISSKRGAELSIAALVSVVNVCTANNTVAILTVGGIAKHIGDRFGIDNRKCASILDTFSCFTQGLIPYGAQMLMAAGLASLNPVSILPYLYYPFAIGITALLAILLRYPRRYS